MTLKQALYHTKAEQIADENGAVILIDDFDPSADDRDYRVFGLQIRAINPDDTDTLRYTVLTQAEIAALGEDGVYRAATGLR